MFVDQLLRVQGTGFEGKVVGSTVESVEQVVSAFRVAAQFRILRLFV